MNLAATPISLLPLGEVPPALLEALARDLEAHLGLPSRTEPERPLPRQTLHPERGQHNSSLLLGLLRRIASPGPLLGVTEADLFAPGLNFVFGEAELGGRVAVISLSRLREESWGRRPDAALLHRRTLTEAIHEVGHTLGLGHCPEETCAMHFSTCLADTDYKGPGLCPRCRAWLL